MPKHIHAELMMQYAQDAMGTDKPWERWEVNYDGEWNDLCISPEWIKSAKYRRKPKNVTINGFEVVQELETVIETKCFIEDASDIKFCFTGVCNKYRVHRGIAHKTKESAIASCKARLGIDPNQE